MSLTDPEENALELRHIDTHFHVEMVPDKKPFLELINGCGGPFMWDDLAILDDPSWIAESFAQNLHTCRTNDAYEKKKGHDLYENG